MSAKPTTLRDFLKGCPSIIMSQGGSLQVSDSTCKILIHSLMADAQAMRNFALGFAGKVQAEDAAGTTVVALTGMRMGFIGIKQLLQAIFIFVTGFTFGGKLLGVVVDGLVNDCDVLAVVDDVEGGKLGVVVGNNVELALILALAQSTVALDEESGEVLDVVVQGKLTEFEAGVLEEILVEDASVDQGSLDFGLVLEL